MALLPWRNIQTVLLDMDGTLLDLTFDNQFWLEHLPLTLSKKTGKSLNQCKLDMQIEYQKVHGRLQWYCLDYWADLLQLDIIAAKREISHLIRMRSDCIPFLEALKHSGREVVLVTNAHPASLSLKIEHTQLDKYIDTLISTHEFGVSKESQALWQALHDRLGFAKQHTLFVDDSQAILDAAKEFGIAYTLGITNPDSELPENQIERHLAINDYRSLIDSIIEDNFAIS